MRLVRVAALAFPLLLSQGCLVLTLHPSHEPEALVWDQALVGEWQNSDDNTSVTVDRDEWQSYRITYVHPIETGELTGYLSEIGTERYMDLMPARGKDHGAFLVPVHATVRITLQEDRLEVTPLSYDWLFDRLRKKQAVPGVEAAFDEKENALILSPTMKLRAWLRKLGPKGPAWGASAVFTRKR